MQSGRRQCNGDMTLNFQLSQLMDNECKVVLVGDSRCGKSCLLRRFVSDTFSQEYIPTGFGRYSLKHQINEEAIEFTMLDTSVMCHFLTVVSRNEEILCTDLPIVLCGCQSDARFSPSPTNEQGTKVQIKKQEYPVSLGKILSLSRFISAVTYVETSAKCNPKSVLEAFEMAALAAKGRLNRYQFHIFSPSLMNKEIQPTFQRKATNCFIM
ncbi:Rho-related GTP-binding protein RhoE [Nymphon striatum]|nr:Rho-related GTP-binding protein RhoE [Nymphon striatum]